MFFESSAQYLEHSSTLRFANYSSFPILLNKILKVYVSHIGLGGGWGDSESSE